MLTQRSATLIVLGIIACVGLAASYVSFLTGLDAMVEHLEDREPAPVRVRIPAIGVDAPITQVGNKPDGSMDIPHTADEVGWYEPGFRPGEMGNAVLAGHLDTASGKPAVFWRLRTLQEGDEILVDREDGSIIRFRVTNHEAYPMDSAPLPEIFGAAHHVGLNLITCNGAWQQHLATYTQRLVVYSELFADDEGITASNINTQP